MELELTDNNNNTNKSHEKSPGRKKSVLNCCLWKGGEGVGKGTYFRLRQRAAIHSKDKLEKINISATFLAHLHSME